MTLWQKLIAGADSRKTRLHDATGQRVSTSRLLRNGPRSFATTVFRLAFDKRPHRPWISYDAQDEIARHLDRSSRVLEFGSGMSTRWLAAHAGSVLSFEDHEEWHKLVKAQLEGVSAKVDYRFAPTPKAYTDLSPDAEFDFVLVDGRYRDACTEVGLERLAPGGMLYLDNSDHLDGGQGGNVPRAVALIEAAARREGWSLKRFTDFAPCNFFAQAGLMLRKPR